MKKIFLFSWVLFSFMATVHAQDSSSISNSSIISKYRIAVFAPLYLDSAFDGANEYRYAKNVFPKYINSGLEFYEGVQLALDSLAKERVPLEVFIYDTRSAHESVQSQLNRPEMDSMNLMITHCSSNEVRLFSEAGLKRSIPVINTTIPNDGGTSANPFLVVLNPTLRTQCDGIYRYIQKYFSINPVIVFRKKGSNEDQIKSLFDEYAKSTVSVPLKMRYVELQDSFSVNQLKAVLDSTRHSICISGTLDVNFGKRLTAQLATINKQYPVTVMGMPTWDGIKDFTRPEFKGIEIIYGTPFYNPKTDRLSQEITNDFNTDMYARPSDMVFRGYEVTYKFSKLLLHYGKDLSSNLGNKQYKVFTDFDIQPVLNKSDMSLQYFENKKLYFLKWQDGLIKSVL